MEEKTQSYGLERDRVEPKSDPTVLKESMIGKMVCYVLLPMSKVTFILGFGIQKTLLETDKLQEAGIAILRRHRSIVSSAYIV